MGKGTAFKNIPRYAIPKRAIEERLKDWNEVEGDYDAAALRAQASRCMDCGIPFCHKGCPLGNHIPDWNDLVYRKNWRGAIDRLHATNNFPEFTGRICPAPCEESCVLNINSDAVTIRQIEKQLIDNAWQEDWVKPQPPAQANGYRIAIIGSGPAGLACAQQLCRAGYQVTVFERDQRAGGLLTFGIPDFKLEKWVVERRVQQLQSEGVVFEFGVDIGTAQSFESLRTTFDATVVAVGAQQARTLSLPGSDAQGIHLAMNYLTEQNRVVAGELDAPKLSAAGKRVVILGGGDTGADCLGTANRQGAQEVFHFHYKPAPPSERTDDMPWPWWPMTLRESSSHEEGGTRHWSVIPTSFSTDTTGQLTHINCLEVTWEEGQKRMSEVSDSEFSLEVDMALIAIGFAGAEVDGFNELVTTNQGTVSVNSHFETPLPGVFACGDATRGASLVVWAIWEGREAARAVDVYLTGDSNLPSLPNRHPI